MDKCWNLEGVKCPPRGACHYPLQCIEAARAGMGLAGIDDVLMAVQRFNNGTRAALREIRIGSKEQGAAFEACRVALREEFSGFGFADKIDWSKVD